MLERQTLLLLSSILMTGMFFMSGISKLKGFSGTCKGLMSKPIFKSLPKIFSKLAIIIVILLEIVAPIIIVMGVYNNNLKDLAAYSSLGLFAFTFLATLLYHYPPKGIEFYFFLKNITIMGGLLSLYLNFI